MVFFAVVSIGVLFYMMRDRKLLEEENNQLIRVIDDGNALYQQVVDENKNLKYAKHDYKKQQQIVNKIKEKEYFDDLTGSRLIGLIVETKKREAESQNIRFTLAMDRLANWNIDDGQTISLFTNLIDNAMEAANKAENAKYIEFRLLQKGDNIYITIKNSKAKNEKPLEHNMITTKSDYENHGYGVSIIRDIVCKNNGHIDMVDNVDEFSIEIVI